MKKVLFLAAALFVCTSFSFAVDLETESFDVYSFDSITTSALEYAVMPLAAADWSTIDSDNLAAITRSLTLNLNDTVLGQLYDIYDKLFYIKQSTDYMSNMNTQLTDIAYLLGTNAGTTYDSVIEYLDSIKDYLDSVRSNLNTINGYYPGISSNLNSMKSLIDYNFGVVWPAFVNGSYVSNATTFPNLFGNTMLSLNYDTQIFAERSLYGRIKQLQETLASDDDLALAESQKQNREEIEDSFLNGSSGSTSLGASDFGDLSDVGGTVKDSISLNGQASVSSFTSGLVGADESGQGWFSAATRDSLDSVSGSVSTFALDDPYNMSGWYDRYSWVEGD